jgi:hypothetical protein
MIEKEDNSNIPEYFDNGDYVMDLFCSFNKNEFESLLNEVQNWPYKYEYNCFGLNKLVKNEKADLYTIYFISPTLLILDIIGYSTGLKYYNNFIPIYRYRFDSSFKFNKKRGKFDFVTKLTVLYEIIHLPNCILSNNWSNQILNESEEWFKKIIIPNLVNIVESYAKIFSDIYEKMTEEIFQKKIKIKQNMNTDNYDDGILDDIFDSEDLENSLTNFFNENINDIINKSITIGKDFKNENNYINNEEKNIQKSKKIKKEEFKEDLKEENKNNNNNNNLDNNQNKTKKIEKEYILLIIIIIIKNLLKNWGLYCLRVVY